MTLEQLGETLKQRRKAQGWSQKELETYSGISMRTLSKIENGFSEEVGIKKVSLLLDLLGEEFSLRPKSRPKTLEELRDAH